MYETSKSVLRRLHDSRFATRYFTGKGVDIGCGLDSLNLYRQQFPLMDECRSWDIPDGDAQFLASIPDESLDFAHSSHCLEHLEDPAEALGHWLRVLVPGGHLVVTVPDEDLYEQGDFPSRYNTDHKWTFTLHKVASWSPQSINLLDLLAAYAGEAQILKVEQLDATYRFGLPRFDQTSGAMAESALEFVLRKWTPEEKVHMGRYPDGGQLPGRFVTG